MELLANLALVVCELWRLGDSRCQRTNKRSRFLADLEELAAEKGLTYREETWRGKGGHAMVWVGDKVTTVPSREIDPKTAEKIRKALGPS